MAKYHIRKDGTPGICHATGKCPLGGDSGQDNHFDTVKEAQKAVDKINESKHGALSLSKKERERQFEDKAKTYIDNMKEEDKELTASGKTNSRIQLNEKMREEAIAKSLSYVYKGTYEELLKDANITDDDVRKTAEDLYDTHISEYDSEHTEKEKDAMIDELHERVKEDFMEIGNHEDIQSEKYEVSDILYDMANGEYNSYVDVYGDKQYLSDSAEDVAKEMANDVESEYNERFNPSDWPEYDKPDY